MKNWILFVRTSRFFSPRRGREIYVLELKLKLKYKWIESRHAFKLARIKKLRISRISLSIKNAYGNGNHERENYDMAFGGAAASATVTASKFAGRFSSNPFLLSTNHLPKLRLHRTPFSAFPTNPPGAIHSLSLYSCDVELAWIALLGSFECWYQICSLFADWHLVLHLLENIINGFKPLKRVFWKKKCRTILTSPWRLMIDAGLKYQICAVSGAAIDPVSSNKENGERSPETWKIKMLYDGDCPLCMREVVPKYLLRI